MRYFKKKKKNKWRLVLIAYLIGLENTYDRSEAQFLVYLWERVIPMTYSWGEQFLRDRELYHLSGPGPNQSGERKARFFPVSAP